MDNVEQQEQEQEQQLDEQFLDSQEANLVSSIVSQMATQIYAAAFAGYHSNPKIKELHNWNIDKETDASIYAAQQIVKKSGYMNAVTNTLEQERQEL